MILLLGFAVLAGAGTALSPCVLPVLPALLSAAGVSGRRRPLGVVVGLTVTFTVTIVGIASVVGGVGLGSDPLRDVAVAVLLVMGIALFVPDLSARVEAWLAPLARIGVSGIRSANARDAGRGAGRDTGQDAEGRGRGDGFVSGLVVGAALGLVYTPCAGPILAAVISVSAASGRTVAVAIAYALGSGAVLLALALGGHRLSDRVRRAGHGLGLQRVLGAVMVVTAIAIATEVDVNFDQYVAQHIPDVNLAASLEKSGAVQRRLPEISGHKAKFQASVKAPSEPKYVSQAKLLADARRLKDLGTAPEFTETEEWFNTGANGRGHTPLTLAGLRGHVVLVDFWTYTCINCIRTLPYLKAWDAAYRKDGLTIVGVQTPEFQFEHDASNVANAIEQFGIKYPVVQDNEMGTWDAYGNEYWPADYLIDSHGQVRYATFGEGDYSETETAIRALLAESGARVGGMSRPTGVIVPSEQATPETYLGTARAEGWIDGPHSGVHDYGPGGHPNLQVSEFAYTGTWNIAAQPAEAVSDAGVEVEFEAKNVYLVLSPSSKGPSTVQVLLDGHPIPTAQAGADVHGGAVTVTHQRLYSLVSLPDDQQHRLTLRFAPGVTGYAFTFG